MTALSFVMPIAGAVGTIGDQRKGWIGYAAAILIGAVVGACGAWSMRIVRSSLKARPHGLWFFRALYIAAVVWIILALFLGSFATKCLIAG